MEIFVVWIILSVLVGIWASGRGHSGLGMFCVALLLSPLIAALIEAVRGPSTQALEQTAVADGVMRKCPACAEIVRAEAVKCRYCGEPLPKMEASDLSPEERAGM